MVTLTPRGRGKGAADELGLTRSWREGLAQLIAATGSSSYPTSPCQGRAYPALYSLPTHLLGPHIHRGQPCLCQTNSSSSYHVC